MKESEYEIMYDLENTYWWFIGKQSLVRDILKGDPDTIEYLTEPKLDGLAVELLYGSRWSATQSAA